MPTLKKLQDILDEIGSGIGSRGMTGAKLQDLIYSAVAVGGTLHGLDKTQVVTTSWAPFTAYDGSIDTKGIADNVPAGTFTLGAGADGVYAVDASVCMSFPGNGTVELALTKNGSLTPFRAHLDVETGKVAPLIVQGSGNLAEGDVIGLAIKGSGSATGTIEAAQFRAFRI